MAQLQRVEGKIELKCPADKFFNAWTQSIYLLPEVCPDKFKKIELHEGTKWHSVGAIKTWHYIHDGRHEFVVKKVTEVDEKTKYVHYDYVDGHFLRTYFNSFKSSIQAIPKGDSGCFVKISIECENKTQDAPDANIYVHFLLGAAKGMGDRLCTA